MPRHTSISCWRKRGTTAPRTGNATRPHQLFLTGDQIYADEGNDILLNLVGEAGSALLAGFQASGFNWEEELPIQDGLLLVDVANKKSIPTPEHAVHEHAHHGPPDQQRFRRDELRVDVHHHRGATPIEKKAGASADPIRKVAEEPDANIMPITVAAVQSADLVKVYPKLAARYVGIQIMTP
jgi:hypothetical protein